MTEQITPPADYLKEDFRNVFGNLFNNDAEYLKSVNQISGLLEVQSQNFKNFNVRVNELTQRSNIDPDLKQFFTTNSNIAAALADKIETNLLPHAQGIFIDEDVLLVREGHENVKRILQGFTVTATVLIYVTTFVCFGHGMVLLFCTVGLGL